MTRRRGRKRKAAPVTVAIVTLENPYFNPDPLYAKDETNPSRIDVNLSMRESYITYLRGQRLITEEEYKAAEKVCAAFERLGGAGAGALDYTREVVDGGTTPVPPVEVHTAARKTLEECRKALGPYGHDLVLKMAGEGLWPKDIARNDRKMRDYLSLRFRECLECLAVTWGYQKRRTVAI